MVVEDAGECCGGKTCNLKIHGGVSVHVAHTLNRKNSFKSR